MSDPGLGLVLLMAVCGGVGAAARFVADGAIRARRAHRASAVPVATVVVNVSGSLLIGLLHGAALFHGLGPTWLLLAATGFCGGFTTFSTAMAETVRLVQSDAWRWAVANALGTLLLCVGAASAGVGIMWLTSG